MKKVNKKKKTNNLKVFVITVLIILAISIIQLLLSYLTPSGKATRKVKYINSDKVGDGVMPIGNTSYWYSKYDGEIDSNVVDKSVSYFAKTLIPEYRKIDDVKSYYKKHKKPIKILLGIEKYEDFDSLVSTIKKLQGNELKFEKCFIVEKSTKKEEKSTKTVVAIQYENNEVVLFTLNIANKIEKKNRTAVQYSASLDKEYSVQRDDVKIDTESHPENGTGRVLN